MKCFFIVNYQKLKTLFISEDSHPAITNTMYGELFEIKKNVLELLNLFQYCEENLFEN